MISWFLEKILTDPIEIGDGKFFRKGEYVFVFEQGKDVITVTHPDLLVPCFINMCEIFSVLEGDLV